MSNFYNTQQNSTKFPSKLGEDEKIILWNTEIFRHLAALFYDTEASENKPEKKSQIQSIMYQGLASPPSPMYPMAH